MSSNLATTLGNIATAGLFATKEEGAAFLGEELVALVIALAYISRATPQDISEIAFTSLPSGERWKEMDAMITQLIDQINAS